MEDDGNMRFNKTIKKDISKKFNRKEGEKKKAEHIKKRY